MIIINNNSGRTGSENKKTVFGALKPNEMIRHFESLQRYDKKFYASVHEQYSQKKIYIREIFLKFVKFIYHEYKVKM